MITSVSTAITEMLDSPVRDVKARVEIYLDSTLVETCTCGDRIREFTVERIGEESKFFGFGICQKLNIKLIDLQRNLNISTKNKLVVELGTGNTFVKAFPTFYVSEVHRDENNNELSITAYDIMYPDSGHFVADMPLLKPYTIEEFVDAAAMAYGLPANSYDIQRVPASYFAHEYAEGANLEGTELLREALNDLAEVTGSIFFIDHRDKLVFKGLDKNAAPDFTITKDKYFTLKDSTNRRLSKIVHATELGDSMYVGGEVSGTTQYLRDNAFLETRSNAEVMLEDVFELVNGLTINQFTCDWRGNFLTEIGDKIAMVTKDNQLMTSFIINDSITYNGGLSEDTSWKYTNTDAESESYPTTLGDMLKQTYARVDKVNKQIDLVAGSYDNTRQEIGSLQITTNQIQASVTSVSNDLDIAVNGLEGEIDYLKKQVSSTMTEDEIQLLIQTSVEDNVTSVTTTTGFTFNEAGLTIDKNMSEMKTIITEDGMTIHKNNDVMLIVNNEGVQAKDLHATSFLIIGETSRFEDFENGTRTGCFWIGG